MSGQAGQAQTTQNGPRPSPSQAHQGTQGTQGTRLSKEHRASCQPLNECHTPPESQGPQTLHGLGSKDTVKDSRTERTQQAHSL